MPETVRGLGGHELSSQGSESAALGVTGTSHQSTSTPGLWPGKQAVMVVLTRMSEPGIRVRTTITQARRLKVRRGLRRGMWAPADPGPCQLVSNAPVDTQAEPEVSSSTLLPNFPAVGVRVRRPCRLRVRIYGSLEPHI